MDGASPYTTPTAADPTTATTGVEFSIPLVELGDVGATIRITAFLNNGGHDYASNQFAGVGILDGNLGGNGFGGFTGDLSGVDLDDFAGDQFVTVLPEPSGASSVLVVLGSAVWLSRRRAGGA